MKLRFGISPCPNDTFAFHGLLTGTSDAHGLDLEIVLADVQELNERLARGDLAAGKASFAQALRMTRDFGVLPAGAAIGFGVGPLLIAARPRPFPDGAARVLCPGEGTTATLLLRRFHPAATNVTQVTFTRIQRDVAAGRADFGVVIHEGRFTYQRQGLHCIDDLGARWEAATGSPLPRRAARAPDEALVTMRRHAQELDDEAILQHVALYVNDLTVELGEAGAAALAAFERAARDGGFAPRDAPPLSILR